MIALGGLALPALAANPEARRLNEMAVSRTAEGRYEEAAGLFSEALRLSPDDEVIRQNLAHVKTALGHQQFQAGQFENAEAQYQAAIDLVADEVPALLGLGDVLLRQRDVHEAAEMYRRAVQAAPAAPEGYLRLGEAYYQQGDLNGALTEWERALGLQPEDARLRQRMAQVQREVKIESGYRERASQHFQLRFEGERLGQLGQDALSILEQAYQDVGYEVGHYPKAEVQVVLYSQEDFRTLTGLPHWVGAAYSNFDGKIRLPVRGVSGQDRELRRVLFHEYTHAAVYGITRGNMPAWLNEGLAIHAEGGPAGRYQEVVRAAARSGDLIPLRRLGGQLIRLGPSEAALAYAEGYAATASLRDRFGVSGVHRLLLRLGEGAEFSSAFWEAFGMSLEDFEARWREELARGS